MMTETIEFKCQHCGLPYLAKTALRSNQHSGTIECVDCDKPAHEWTGFYEVFDWHPVGIQTPISNDVSG